MTTEEIAIHPGQPCPSTIVGNGKTRSPSGTSAHSAMDKSVSSIRSRAVRFDMSGTQVHDVPSRSTMNMRDFEAVWFLKEDYQRMNSWIRLTLNQMRQGLPEEDDLCYRGLEHRVNSAARDQYHSVVSGSIHAVLVEQDRQWRESLGIEHPEEIANVYRGFSIASQLEGYQRGKKDARIVAEYIEAERRDALGYPSETSDECPQQQPSSSSSSSPDRPVRHRKAQRRNSFLMEAEDVDYVPPSSCHHLDCFTSEQEFNTQSLTLVNGSSEGSSNNNNNSSSCSSSSKIESSTHSSTSTATTVNASIDEDSVYNSNSSNEDSLHLRTTRQQISDSQSSKNRKAGNIAGKLFGPPKRTLSATTPRYLYNTLKNTLDPSSTSKLKGNKASGTTANTEAAGKNKFRFPLRLPSSNRFRNGVSSSSSKSLPFRANRRPSL